MSSTDADTAMWIAHAVTGQSVYASAIAAQEVAAAEMN
jgi:hypothetical protein